MSLTQTEKHLLQNVFSKVKYDKLNQKYFIHPEDYLLLGLSKEEMKKLEEMCKENNIELEKLPRKLSKQETEDLFKKYINLKNNNKSSKQTEEKMIAIRNQIAEGYMEKVCQMIMKQFPNFSERQDKEDIYQMGYEELLRLIETYDPTRDISFNSFISLFLVQHVLRRVGILNTIQLSITDNINIMKLSKAKESLENKGEDYLSIEKLSEVSGIPQNEIEILMKLESIKLVTLSEDIEQPIPDELETMFSKHHQKEKITKIIETIPTGHRIALELYFGLNGHKSHNQIEVARMMRMTREAARQHIAAALRFLKYSLWQSHLRELNEEENIEQQSDTTKISTEEKQRNNAIILFLIKQLPKETFLELINEIHPDYRDILLHYFGLKDGKEYTIKELSLKYNITPSGVTNRLRKSIEKLEKPIIQMYKTKYQGTARQDQSYIDNLVIDYLSNSKTKR